MNIAVEETVAAAPVKVSDRAATRIARLIGETPASTALRISVEGGGCSGFQYKFDFIGDADVTADDLVIRKGGATVVVDRISLPYMFGSEVDLVANLMGEGIEVHNPLAVASCGCGTSFSI